MFGTRDSRHCLWRDHVVGRGRGEFRSRTASQLDINLDSDFKAKYSQDGEEDSPSVKVHVC